MTIGVLESVEAWTPVVALRNSLYAYPLVNGVHILGVALLVGSIVPLDLRLAGLWSSVAIQPLWRILARMALAGFVLAAVSGTFLFATRATEYADSWLFLAKLGLIGLAGLNALWLIGTVGAASRVDRPAVRIAACLSALAWVSVLFLGRLVGYF